MAFPDMFPDWRDPNIGVSGISGKEFGPVPDTAARPDTGTVVLAVAARCIGAVGGCSAA